VGGDIVGAALDESNVQRASLMAQRLGLPLGAELSCADVVAQLKHPLGYTRCLPAGSRCVVFVSKAQAPRAAELAEAIAAAGFEVILGEWVRPPYIVRRLGG